MSFTLVVQFRGLCMFVEQDDRFGEYGARFTNYLETPPTVTFPSTAYRAIFAARDRFRDSVTVPWRIDKRSRVTMVVFDANGTEVRRLTTSRGGVPVASSTFTNSDQPAATSAGLSVTSPFAKSSAAVG